MAYKFNPAFQSDDEAVSNFVVRQPELAEILTVLRGAATPRIILVAPRGAGKTTMCRRVLAEISTDEGLRARWQPIFLGEESYTVTTPGEFFLECLFHLAEDAGEPILKAQHREAMGIVDEQPLLERCLEILREVAADAGKRLLVVVENFHMLLNDQIGSDRSILLNALADETVFGVLATSVAQSSDENSGRPLDGYRILPLRPLTLEECHALWAALTTHDVPRARIRPLQILTGGSPRLIHILADFMRTPSLGDLMGNLNQLIDQNTEYFKSQLDTLPAVERKVFAALLDAWDPSTAKQIAEAARVNVNTASAMLGRLSDRGSVLKEQGRGRSVLYYAAERLFNIYYLMRRRSHPSSRVRALVAFMTEYYDRDELVATTAKLVDEACRFEPAKRTDYHWAFDAILTGQPETVRARILAQTPADFLQSLRQDVLPAEIAPGLTDAEALDGDGDATLERLLREARDAVENEDADRAKQLLADAAAISPSNPMPFIQLAFAHLQLHEHDESISAAERAVERDPANPGVHSMLGLMLSFAGQTEQAEAAFNRALEIDPACTPAILHLARLRDRNDDEDGALYLYRRAAALGELTDDAAAHFARILLRRDKDSEAEMILRQALEDSNDRSDSRHLLATLLTGTGRAEEAISLLRQVAEGGEDWMAWADLGAFLSAEEKFAEAREALDRSVAIGADNPAVYRMLSTAMRNLGEPAEAIVQIADTMVTKHADDAWAWITAGDIFSQSRRLDRAENAYRHATTLEDGEPAWVRLARLLMEKSASDADAESALRKAVEAVLESGACGPMREVAELLVHHGDDDDALELLDEALAANEHCYCSLVLQGDIAARRHDEEGAREHFAAALALNDVGVSALTGLARISAPSDAQELIGRAMEADPDNPKCLLARAQLIDRELQSKIEDGSEALKRDPDLTEARLFLAPLEVKRGDVQAAMAHLSAALPELESRRELIPSFVDTSLELARAGLGAELTSLFESEEGRTVEPLSVALRLDRGETPAVAKEIREVALDILDQLRSNER
ncbi:tetratricopeptide repeat protein [Sphingobium sp. DC-2]|uniref:tetratricopeptide repeat protein n=1 Tax=Sphingobium sp. DC-2 TaxID=1303256 RepID=UPI00068A533C|nr:tetratricopeptide repeat protein [Sphingobium sp. DC-2]